MCECPLFISLSLQAAKCPADVAAVVCLNVTAGQKAARKLSKDRYFKFVDVCTAGGMDLVAKDEHFQNLFERNAANRERLLATDPGVFMARMRSWGDFLQRAGDPQKYPVTGLDVRPTTHLPPLPNPPTLPTTHLPVPVR